MNPHEPKVILYYIERAEALLEGMSGTKASLTVDDRQQLERLTGKVRALVRTMDVNVPVPHGQLNTLLLFVEIVGALGPRHESVKARARNAKAATARAGNIPHSDMLDAIVLEEYGRDHGVWNVVLARVNARLKKLGRPAIKRSAYFERKKRIRRYCNRAGLKDASAQLQLRKMKAIHCMMFH